MSPCILCRNQPGKESHVVSIRTCRARPAHRLRGGDTTRSRVARRRRGHRGSDARRARFQHAGPHHRGRVPRDARGADSLHAGRRHARVEGGDRREIPPRERDRMPSRERFRGRGRQASALQRADGDPRPGRRSADPGALVDCLCGPHAIRGGRADHSADSPGRRFQASCRGPRARHHAAYEMADAQLAFESDRNGLLRGGVSQSRSGARAPSRPLDHQRRDVRAHPVRRRVLRILRGGGAAARRPHADGERPVEVLRHDRLAAGICLRRRRADPRRCGACRDRAR